MNDRPSELKSIVEAALFASAEAVSLKRLQGLFHEEATPTREELETVIESLQEDYRDRGIELRRVGKGYRFNTRESFAPWLRKLSQSKPPRYSRALLETLSIIAYRQPVTRGDIEDIRGVGVSSDIIRTLLERDWIKQVGVRDVPGHPALFATTRTFLEYFNLKSIKELPDLSEARDPFEIAREMNLELPMMEVEAEETEELGGTSSESEAEEYDESRGKSIERDGSVPGRTKVDGELSSLVVDTGGDESIVDREEDQEQDNLLDNPREATS